MRLTHRGSQVLRHPSDRAVVWRVGITPKSADEMHERATAASATGVAPCRRAIFAERDVEGGHRSGSCLLGDECGKVIAHEPLVWVGLAVCKGNTLRLQHLLGIATVVGIAPSETWCHPRVMRQDAVSVCTLGAVRDVCTERLWSRSHRVGEVAVCCPAPFGQGLQD